jgi:hypothetical protein
MVSHLVRSADTQADASHILVSPQFLSASLGLPPHILGGRTLADDYSSSYSVSVEAAQAQHSHAFTARTG